METLGGSPNPPAVGSREPSSRSPDAIDGDGGRFRAPDAIDGDGGRFRAPATGSRSSDAIGGGPTMSVALARSETVGLEATYTFGGVAKILEVPESKLRYWAQVGFVGPSVRRGGKPLYSFQDLVSVKAAKELVDRGFKAAEIRKAIEEVRASLPHLDRPLDRMRVAFDGTRLVIVDEGSAFESTGQRVFGFGLGELARQISDIRSASAVEGSTPPAVPAVERATVEEPPADDRAPKRRAYDWFVEGTRAEIGGGDAHAEHCYRQALMLDAGLAAARTNLGSLAYRRGDCAGAREAFEAALAIDPDQPEARFNLANIVLEGGDLELAVAEFRRVLQTAPDFADAHYNLAVALDSLGGRAAARAHLERYLALESDVPPWAEQARALIARLD
jgi:tetratricopeptide (TPR) repeat protein